MADTDDIPLPEMLDLAVDDATAIKEGVDAARRLVRRQDLTDQLKVARLLMVGRRAALVEIGANDLAPAIAPAGKPYNMAFNRWLKRYPRLAVLHPQVRADALWCLEAANWPRVQAELAKLDDRERQRVSLRTLRRWIETAERRSAPPPQRPPAPEPVAKPSQAQPVGKAAAPASQAVRADQRRQTQQAPAVVAEKAANEMPLSQARQELAEARRQLAEGRRQLAADRANMEAEIERRIRHHIDTYWRPRWGGDFETANKIKAYKKGLTEKEYRTIALAAHPDNSASVETKNEAIDILTKKHNLICDGSAGKTLGAGFPTTRQGWEAAKAARAAAAKAKAARHV
jgi:hypothetical protein